MATLTVTATLLGSFSSKVTAMTAVALDIYHVLHGLGATPTDIYVTLRSAHFSVPTALVVGSYDMTMCYMNVQSGGAVGTGAADVIFRRGHSYIL